MSKREEWGSAPQALAVLSEVNEGRKFGYQHLYSLCKNRSLEKRRVDGRTFQYNLTQARQIRIGEKKGSGRKPRETTV